MTDLARPVGLGLAARGDVKDVADWARRAEDLGLDSVWVHDSYFERDPITYLTAIGQVTRHIGLGAGALNPYTRHPVVLAMTMSALDDLAPRRCTWPLVADYRSGSPRWRFPTTTPSRASPSRSIRYGPCGAVSP
ncbi:MAG: LLM class flavin-dependent oxidoreductase [Chloroflexi bacterium]|nr:MAG: LLM class flavin-dependent oxidoreductase [Chloroflexota bacterium]